MWNTSTKKKGVIVCCSHSVFWGGVEGGRQAGNLADKPSSQSNPLSLLPEEPKDDDGETEKREKEYDWRLARSFWQSFENIPGRREGKNKREEKAATNSLSLLLLSSPVLSFVFSVCVSICLSVSPPPFSTSPTHLFSQTEFWYFSSLVNLVFFSRDCWFRWWKQEKKYLEMKGWPDRS